MRLNVRTPTSSWQRSARWHDLASAYFEARKAEAIAGLQENRAALDAFAALLADRRTVRHDEIMDAVGDLLKPRKLEPFIWTGGKRNGYTSRNF